MHCLLPEHPAVLPSVRLHCTANCWTPPPPFFCCFALSHELITWCGPHDRTAFAPTKDTCFCFVQKWFGRGVGKWNKEAQGGRGNRHRVATWGGLHLRRQRIAPPHQHWRRNWMSHAESQGVPADPSPSCTRHCRQVRSWGSILYTRFNCSCFIHAKQCNAVTCGTTAENAHFPLSKYVDLRLKLRAWRGALSFVFARREFSRKPSFHAVIANWNDSFVMQLSQSLVGAHWDPRD